MFFINVSIIALSIILQLIAAIWAISTIRVSGQRLAWILLALALILMTLRRVEALSSLDITAPKTGIVLFDVNGLIISALMVVGMAYVRQYFIDIRTAERAVRESEHQYRILAQNIPNAAVLLFNHDLRLTLVEGSIPIPEKYSKESLEGKTIWEVFPQQFAERIAPLAHKALAGEAVSDEVDLPEQVFSLQLFPIRDEQGRVVQGMGMGIDITERLKAERDRQHAYEFLQTTIDGVAEPVMVIGIDYQVMLMNSAIRNEYVGEQAVIPQTCYALSHHRDTPCNGFTHPCPLMQVRQTLLPVTIEHQHETADGELRDIEILASPLFDARGQLTGIVEASRDITERKRAENESDQSRRALLRMLEDQKAAEDALRESELRERERATELQTIMDTVPAMVSIAHDRLCQVVTGNRTVYDVLHMPWQSNTSLTAPAGQQPAHFRIFIDGVEPPSNEFPLQVSAATGVEISNIEEDIVFDDGRVVHLLGNVAPLFGEDNQSRGAVAAFVDITERKRAEDAQEKRAAELEVLASVSAAMRIARNRADIPLIVLGAILKLLKASGAALVSEDERSSNILVETAVGDWSSWQGVCFPADQYRQLLVPLLNQPYLNNQAKELIEQLAPDVPIPNLALAGAPLIADQRRIGNLWFGRPSDISDSELRLLTAICDIVANALQRSSLHENLEAQLEMLQKTQSRLVQSEKLAAIGELVAGVAHELNNPLTAVVLYAQMLQEQSTNPKADNEMAQTIVSEAQRASKIVRGLLEFARQRPPERKPVQINNLLQSSLDLLAYELHTNNIRIETQYTPDLPVTLADPHQFQQVFVNIIANAWQAMQENDRGLLNVSTQIGPSIFGTRQPGDSDVIRIQFQDNGPGISPEHLPHIFDPFFTTKKVGQGTGLGLPICHGIVSEHGGHIWAESTSQQGANFIIELPIVALEMFSDGLPLPADHASIQVTAPLETNAKRILLIDDEKNILTVIKRALQRGGYQVDAVYSGAEGLKLLKKATYDLILCDMRMPEMSGTEFYQVVELRYPELAHRVIFSTGDSASVGTRQFLEETGAICLTKPFEMNELLDRVHEVLQDR